MSIDDRIKMLLENWGYVSPEMLTELPEDTRASALQAYFDKHNAEQPFIMQGETLVAPGSGKQQPPATAKAPRLDVPAATGQPLPQPPSVAPAAERPNL